MSSWPVQKNSWYRGHLRRGGQSGGRTKDKSVESFKLECNGVVVNVRQKISSWARAQVSELKFGFDFLQQECCARGGLCKELYAMRTADGRVAQDISTCFVASKRHYQASFRTGHKALQTLVRMEISKQPCKKWVSKQCAGDTYWKIEILNLYCTFEWSKMTLNTGSLTKLQRIIRSSNAPTKMPF